MAPHQREQAAILAADRVDLAPAGEEVVVDDADDVEAIGDDGRIGKLPLDQRAVGGREIDADDAHLVLALKLSEIGGQRSFRAPQHDIIDGVILEVAKASREAFAARKEVFVDTRIAGHFGECHSANWRFNPWRKWRSTVAAPIASRLPTRFRLTPSECRR